MDHGLGLKSLEDIEGASFIGEAQDDAQRIQGLSRGSEAALMTLGAKK